MLKETLLRALVAVRTKIAKADAMASGWLAERERRRRQEATFLRGIVRLEGSIRKTAPLVGVSERTVRRILDAEGHAKDRTDKQVRRSAATFGNVAAPSTEPEKETMPVNVVKLERRRRRPDWQPREPRRPEMHKWFDQYLSWTASAQATARMLVLNSYKGTLPDAAYYNDDEPRPAKGNGAVGSQKGLAAKGG